MLCFGSSQKVTLDAQLWVQGMKIFLLERELDKEVLKHIEVMNHPQQAIWEARNLKDTSNTLFRKLA